MPEIKISEKQLACIRAKRHKPHKDCGISLFQSQILKWYKKNKRDNLPWRFTPQRPIGAYEILISEIMLQQTQVPRVLDMFPKFLAAFPTTRHLAEAPLDTVLKEWQGMGYNRRALYLKRSTQEVMKKFGGHIPSDTTLLETLPGIGPYTSGAISCFAFNMPAVFLDTNIRKFFIHYFFPHGRDNKKISDADILPIAERLLYKKNPRIWNYALMDYGALILSRKPELLSRAKNYHKQSPFLGSSRFFRSQIIQYLLKHKQAPFDELQKISPYNIKPILASLCREGLIKEIQPDIFAIASLSFPRRRESREPKHRKYENLPYAASHD